MKNNHKIISIILIVVFVACAGIYFYKKYEERRVLKNIALNYLKTKDLPLKNTSLVTKDGVDTFTNNDYGFSISFPHSLPTAYGTSSKVVTDAKTDTYSLKGTNDELNGEFIDTTKENFSILVQDISAFQSAKNWEYKPLSTTIQNFQNGLTGELITQADSCDGIDPCGMNLVFAADPVTNQKAPYQLVFNLSDIPKNDIASQKELFLKIIGSTQFINTK